MNPIKKESSIIKARVAKVIDDYTLVINRGSTNGVEEGQRFLIYALGEILLDPEDNTSLGALEIVRGTGRVIHLQERIATIGSDMKASPQRSVRRVRRHNILDMVAPGFGQDEVEEILPATPVPFEGARVGDLVKPV